MSCFEQSIEEILANHFYGPLASATGHSNWQLPACQKTASEIGAPNIPALVSSDVLRCIKGNHFLCVNDALRSRFGSARKQLPVPSYAMVAIADFSAMIATDPGQPRRAAEAVCVLTPARAASPAFLQTTGPCQSCEVVPPLLRPTRMPLGSTSDEFQQPISEIVPSSSWAPLDAKKAEVSRWWTKAGNLVCPLSGLPIKLLPYPPFKMRSDPAKPEVPKLCWMGNYWRCI